MAIRDGVDVGSLGLLCGFVRPHSQRQILARTLLGSALGALAIDAGLSDEVVIRSCQAAIDHRGMSLSTARRDIPIDLIGCGWGDDAEHQDLALNLLRMAVHDLHPLESDLMGLCQLVLKKIRAVTSDAEVNDAVATMTQAIWGRS